MQQFSGKERFRLANTLNCIPYMLQGYGVLIDLVNEISVAGILDSTDGAMNLYLTNAVQIDRNGGQHPFEVYMVRNRLIRQIHIPNSIDIEKELQETMQRGILKRPRQSKNLKRTFKQKRAQERHKETLELIRQQKETPK